MRLFGFSLICLLFLLEIAGFLIWPKTGYAQDETFLRVVVLSDEDGTPITGATLLMYDEQQPDELVEAVASNRDGFYEFRNIEPGTYLFRIRFIGFQTHKETPTFESGGCKEMRIYLEGSVEEFENVVVEAQRLDVDLNDWISHLPEYS